MRDRTLRTLCLMPNASRNIHYLRSVGFEGVTELGAKALKARLYGSSESNVDHHGGARIRQHEVLQRDAPGNQRPGAGAIGGREQPVADAAYNGEGGYGKLGLVRAPNRFHPQGIMNLREHGIQRDL